MLGTHMERLRLPSSRRRRRRRDGEGSRERCGVHIKKAIRGNNSNNSEEKKVLRNTEK